MSGKDNNQKTRKGVGIKDGKDKFYQRYHEFSNGANSGAIAKTTLANADTPTEEVLELKTGFDKVVNAIIASQNKNEIKFVSDNFRSDSEFARKLYKSDITGATRDKIINALSVVEALRDAYLYDKKNVKILLDYDSGGKYNKRGFYDVDNVKGQVNKAIQKALFEHISSGGETNLIEETKEKVGEIFEKAVENSFRDDRANTRNNPLNPIMGKRQKKLKASYVSDEDREGRREILNKITDTAKEVIEENKARFDRQHNNFDKISDTSDRVKQFFGKTPDQNGVALKNKYTITNPLKRGPKLKYAGEDGKTAGKTKVPSLFDNILDASVREPTDFYDPIYDEIEKTAKPLFDKFGDIAEVIALKKSLKENASRDVVSQRIQDLSTRFAGNGSAETQQTIGQLEALRGKLDDPRQAEIIPHHNRKDVAMSPKEREKRQHTDVLIKNKVTAKTNEIETDYKEIGKINGRINKLNQEELEIKRKQDFLKNSLKLVADNEQATKTWLAEVPEKDKTKFIANNYRLKENAENLLAVTKELDEVNKQIKANKGESVDQKASLDELVKKQTVLTRSKENLTKNVTEQIEEVNKFVVGLSSKSPEFKIGYAEIQNRDINDKEKYPDIADFTKENEKKLVEIAKEKDALDIEKNNKIRNIEQLHRELTGDDVGATIIRNAQPMTGKGAKLSEEIEENSNERAILQKRIDEQTRINRDKELEKEGLVNDAFAIREKNFKSIREKKQASEDLFELVKEGGDLDEKKFEIKQLIDKGAFLTNDQIDELNISGTDGRSVALRNELAPLFSEDNFVHLFGKMQGMDNEAQDIRDLQVDGGNFTIADLEKLKNASGTEETLDSNGQDLKGAIDEARFSDPFRLAAVKKLQANKLLLEVADKDISAFTEAQKNQQIEDVKTLLKLGGDVDAKDNEGSSVLIIASSRGNTEVSKILINAGAEIDSKDNGKDTALIVASNKGHKDIVTELLKSGADIYAFDNDGDNSLANAIEKQRFSVLHSLITNNNVSAQDIHVLNNDGFNTFDKKIKKDSLDSLDKIKLFERACENRDVDKKIQTNPAFKNIIDFINTDINELDDKDGIRNVYVTYAKKQALNNLLLAEVSKPVDAEGKNGPDLKKIKELIENGADITAKDKHGNNALHQLAGHSADKKVMDYFVQKGLDVNEKNQAGKTPLHRAAEKNKINAIEVLAKSGADLNAANNDGELPIHLATKEKQKNATRLLLSSGADINARKTDGNIFFPAERKAKNYIIQNHLGDINDLGILAEIKGHIKGRNPIDITQLNQLADINTINLFKEYVKNSANIDADGKIQNPVGRHTSKFAGLVREINALLPDPANDTSAWKREALVKYVLVSKATDLLHTEIKKGAGADLQVIEKLLQSNADVNWQNPNGNQTAIAIANGLGDGEKKTKIQKLFSDHQISKAKENTTAVVLTETTLHKFAKKIDVPAPDGNNAHIIKEAKEKNKENLVKLEELIKNDDENVRKDVTKWASFNLKIEVVDEAGDPKNPVKHSYLTPLEVAVRSNNVKAVELLLTVTPQDLVNKVYENTKRGFDGFNQDPANPNRLSEANKLSYDSTIYKMLEARADNVLIKGEDGKFQFKASYEFTREDIDVRKNPTDLDLKKTPEIFALEAEKRFLEMVKGFAESKVNNHNWSGAFSKPERENQIKDVKTLQANINEQSVIQKVPEENLERLNGLMKEFVERSELEKHAVGQYPYNLKSFQKLFDVSSNNIYQANPNMLIGEYDKKITSIGETIKEKENKLKSDIKENNAKTTEKLTKIGKVDLDLASGREELIKLQKTLLEKQAEHKQLKDTALAIPNEDITRLNKEISDLEAKKTKIENEIEIRDANVKAGKPNVSYDSDEDKVAGDPRQGKKSLHEVLRETEKGIEAKKTQLYLAVKNSGLLADSDLFNKDPIEQKDIDAFFKAIGAPIGADSKSSYEVLAGNILDEKGRNVAENKEVLDKNINNIATKLVEEDLKTLFTLAAGKDIGAKERKRTIIKASNDQGDPDQRRSILRKKQSLNDLNAKNRGAIYILDSLVAVNIDLGQGNSLDANKKNSILNNKTAVEKVSKPEDLLVDANKGDQYKYKKSDGTDGTLLESYKNKIKEAFNLHYPAGKGQEPNDDKINAFIRNSNNRVELRSSIESYLRGVDGGNIANKEAIKLDKDKTDKILAKLETAYKETSLEINAQKKLLEAGFNKDVKDLATAIVTNNDVEQETSPYKGLKADIERNLTDPKLQEEYRDIYRDFKEKLKTDPELQAEFNKKVDLEVTRAYDDKGLQRETVGEEKQLELARESFKKVLKEFAYENIGEKIDLKGDRLSKYEFAKMDIFDDKNFDKEFTNSWLKTQSNAEKGVNRDVDINVVNKIRGDLLIGIRKQAVALSNAKIGVSGALSANEEARLVKDWTSIDKLFGKTLTGNADLQIDKESGALVGLIKKELGYGINGTFRETFFDKANRDAALSFADNLTAQNTNNLLEIATQFIVDRGLEGKRKDRENNPVMQAKLLIGKFMVDHHKELSQAILLPKEPDANSVFRKKNEFSSQYDAETGEKLFKFLYQSLDKLALESGRKRLGDKGYEEFQEMVMKKAEMQEIEAQQISLIASNIRYAEKHLENDINWNKESKSGLNPANVQVYDKTIKYEAGKILDKPIPKKVFDRKKATLTSAQAYENLYRQFVGNIKDPEQKKIIKEACEVNGMVSFDRLKATGFLDEVNDTIRTAGSIASKNIFSYTKALRFNQDNIAEHTLFRDVVSGVSENDKSLVQKMIKKIGEETTKKEEFDNRGVPVNNPHYDSLTATEGKVSAKGTENATLPYNELWGTITSKINSVTIESKKEYKGKWEDHLKEKYFYFPIGGGSFIKTQIDATGNINIIGNELYKKGPTGEPLENGDLKKEHIDKFLQRNPNNNLITINSQGYKVSDVRVTHGGLSISEPQKNELLANLSRNVSATDLKAKTIGSPSTANGKINQNDRGATPNQ